MHNTINLYKIQAFTKKISILSQVKKLTKYMITNGIISSLITFLKRCWLWVISCPFSLLLKITTNYTLESSNISITQAIAKAQVLTLAIGMDELNLEEEITSPIIAKYLANIEKIIQLIKIYNKKSIIVIGIYETQKISPEKANEINNNLQALCSSQDVTYIDISSVSKQESFFFTPKSYYLNYQGHRYIYEQILAKLT